jgi:NADP-dependent aldehyde dehydrogenase
MTTTLPTDAADTSRDPRTGAKRGQVEHTEPVQVARLVMAAAAVADEVAATAPSQRSRWLGAVADTLEQHRPELAELADEETALGLDRLLGEVGRAADQARFYASVGVEGGWAQVTIDHLTDGTDLRRVRWPVGPVAVFGASNFPFAFGVVGHDTSSALAAGCPVVVKAHPAHPRLSVRLGELVTAALAGAGAPEGTFAVVVGFDAGLQVVDAPEIAAVGFTGSQAGGMALAQRALARPLPIPVFAEMGTVNPVVVTPAAAGSRLAEVAEGFVGSFTLGQGQFCTKPGLLLVPRGSGAAEAVAAQVRTLSSGWLLTEGIAASCAAGVSRLVDAGAEVVGAAEPSSVGHAAAGEVDAAESSSGGFTSAATVLTAHADELRTGSPLLEECFGPVALVVEYDDPTHLESVLSRLQPSLAGAVATSGPDDPDTAGTVARLAGQVGRVVVDGWPTGVATTWAQHHGGPWPSTSRPDATSVGAAALDRFTRPVAFQAVPHAALPAVLRDDNPWGAPRRVDGQREVAGA